MKGFLLRKSYTKVRVYISSSFLSLDLNSYHFLK